MVAADRARARCCAAPARAEDRDETRRSRTSTSASPRIARGDFAQRAARARRARTTSCPTRPNPYRWLALTEVAARRLRRRRSSTSRASSRACRADDERVAEIASQLRDALPDQQHAPRRRRAPSPSCRRRHAAAAAQSRSLRRWWFWTAIGGAALAADRHRRSTSSSHDDGTPPAADRLRHHGAGVDRDARAPLARCSPRAATSIRATARRRLPRAHVTRRRVERSISSSSTSCRRRPRHDAPTQPTARDGHRACRSSTAVASPRPSLDADARRRRRRRQLSGTCSAPRRQRRRSIRSRTPTLALGSRRPATSASPAASTAAATSSPAIPARSTTATRGGVPLARGVCRYGCIVHPGPTTTACGAGGTCTDGGFYCGGDKLDGDPQTLYRCSAGAGHRSRWTCARRLRRSRRPATTTITAASHGQVGAT